MKTGAWYRSSLRDGRAAYFDGERVEDLEAHAVLGPSVAEVAATYDRFHSPSRAR
jgi:aromatic ring hydroxylase